MASLKGRLSRIKALGLARASSLEGPREVEIPPRAPRSRPPLRGWEPLGPHLCGRRVETGLILPDSMEQGFHRLFFEASPPKASSLSSPVPFADLALFDLETTGLSGGAGTVAFLAALGAFEGRNLVLSQFFMSDYPGEADFLERIAEFFALHPLVVSFNGASFDMPLYRTRRIMNGQAPPRVEHIDLLKTARRLWKRRLPSCSLQSLEFEVLGRMRENDIPGALIPRLWLDYSQKVSEADWKASSEATMERIAEHNAKDVISLAALFLKISALGEDPLGRADECRVHAASLGKKLWRDGRREEALLLLDRAASEGDQEALLALALARRSSGDLRGFAEAVESLEPRNYRVCILKAKVAEHISRDPAAALAWSEKAQTFLAGTGDEAHRVEVERRKSRLIRRLASRSRGSPPAGRRRP